MSDAFGIYCMHNAARSPLLEALLKKLYPDFDYFSGGVVAQENRKLPKNSRDFAKLLGLDEIKQHSENVLAHKELLESATTILGADDLVTDVISRLYPEKLSYSVENFADGLGVRLIDPINTTGYEFEYQLGKFLCCAHMLFRKKISQASNFQVVALLANQRNIRAEAESLFNTFVNEGSNPLIIDCDFKFAANANDLSFIRKDSQVHLDARELLSVNHFELEGTFATRQPHEMSAWESFAVSKDWGDWIGEISKHRSIILLCTPVDVSEGQKHNSFLEAIWADDLSYRVKGSSN